MLPPPAETASSQTAECCIAGNSARFGVEPVAGLPYRIRRELLNDLCLSGPGVLTPPAWTGVPAQTMLDVAAEHHLEGIVCKRLDAPYLPGTRSRAWIKTVLRNEMDAVVAGWIPATGPGGRVGSLVLGAHDPAGRLRYLGHVGTGFTDAERRRLRTELDQLAVARPPLAETPAAAMVAGGRRAAPVRWVSPVLVGSVEYRQLCEGGLRHPSWRGLRSDVPAEQVGLPAEHQPS